MGAKTTDGRAYEVVAHREAYPEGSWWVFDIPALGAAGQTSRLANVAASGAGAAWRHCHVSHPKILPHLLPLTVDPGL